MKTKHALSSTSSQAETKDADPLDASVDRAIETTANHLLARFHGTATRDQRPARPKARPEEEVAVGAEKEPQTGYWVGELEAGTSLESDYVCFLFFLDPQRHREKIQKLAEYIRRKQLPDGSWNTHHGGPGDVSASVKAYLALKLSGRSMEEPFMVSARHAILRMGGAEKANCFTKIHLALLNQLNWRDVPAIPPEIVLLPRFFYFNIYAVACWSRAILIPLSILYARRPQRNVPPQMAVSEIFTLREPRTEEPPEGEDPHDDSTEDRRLLSWRGFFALADRLFKLLEKAPFKPLRKKALKRAEEWVVSRTTDSGGFGAVFPSMVSSVLALRSLGYADDHPAIANTIEKLRELEIVEGDTIRLQPCLSPVWDTALAVNALREAGQPADAPEMVEAGRWLLSKETRRAGDWQLRAPGVEPSGWYFQFRNELCPDVADSAAAILALDRIDPKRVAGIEAAIGRGINWILSLQSSSGGWAAFDADIQKSALAKLPYADHDGMLDPACPDITGGVLEMLGRFPEVCRKPRVAEAIRNAVGFLTETQQHDGTWYGRWGVNYIHGTWQALRGLIAVGEHPDSPPVRRAVAWLKNHQNADGGWGEGCESYRNPAKKGRGTSTASQTSWALMGLVAAGEIESLEVRRGVEFLLRTQRPDGSWDEEQFTGTGLPQVLYLRHHLYRVYFPLLALGYYRNVKKGVSPSSHGGEIVLPPVQRRQPSWGARLKRLNPFGSRR